MLLIVLNVCQVQSISRGHRLHVPFSIEHDIVVDCWLSVRLSQQVLDVVPRELALGILDQGCHQDPYLVPQEGFGADLKR